jgi:hypothetical protein
LVTLNFEVVRDMITLNKRMSDMNAENAPSVELLKKMSKQSEFAQALREDVLKLAPTDPAAARVARDFFPAVPAPKPADQGTAAPAAKDQK